MHHRHRVILVEKDPTVAGVWRYLLAASVRDIMLLPDISADQRVEDLPICQEARWLIGRWISFGNAKLAKQRSRWAQTDDKNHYSWGRTVRARLASQVGKIRHWTIIEGDYTEAPDVEATWFVDPPYQGAGTHYTCGSAELDFGQLGSWCRSRRGQVIVCENEGATWLPFRVFRRWCSVNNRFGGAKPADEIKYSTEAIWTNDAPQTQAIATA